MTIQPGIAGVRHPHVHARMTEIYLSARGSAQMRVEERTVRLTVGGMLVLTPGEVPTFVSTSPEYSHFVLHVPGPPPEEAQADHSAVPRSRLALPERDEATDGDDNAR